MPPPTCGACERGLEWEQVEAGGERWLAVCDCGKPWAFFPARPETSRRTR